MEALDPFTNSPSLANVTRQHGALMSAALGLYYTHLSHFYALRVFLALMYSKAFYIQLRLAVSRMPK